MRLSVLERPCTRLKRAVLVVGLLPLLLARSAEIRAQSSAEVHSVTNPQIEAIQAEKASRSSAQQKMGSQLLDALKESQTGAVEPNAPGLRAQTLSYAPDGNVVVDITGDVSDALKGEVQKLGGKVINAFPEDHAMRASIPLENVEKLAGRNDVRQVMPAVKARTNGSIAIEGDIAHEANLARTNFSVRGAGIRVGVISDSIDDGFGKLQEAENSQAIDSSRFSVLTGQDGDGTGEGLAMVEIVHALAPEAQIVFATGNGGPAQMAANIHELAKQGCQIIVDDLTYNNESPFQDGPISKAVDDVSAQGVLYFSSARNSGSVKHQTSGTWEGDFHDGGPADPKYNTPASSAGRIHMFDTTKRITLNTAVKATPDDRVDLFWSDPIGGSSNDYDLFVVNRNGNVVRASTTSNTGTQPPYQYVNVLKPGESIVIVKSAGAESRFLHLDSGRAVLRYSTGGSVRGHNACGAANAFSVAAKRVPTSQMPFVANPNDAVENFSSDGPRRIFFAPDGTPLTPGNFSSNGGVVLGKPDITAADGVSTTFPSGSSLNPFYGTSAAAPHAAGIAALLLSCKPRPTSAEVRKAFESSALPVDGSVPNGNAGFGIVMASTAAQKLCNKAVSSPQVAAGGSHSTK